ncbi:MAG: hypothetical protein GY711_04525 [bacterium]|nr:hypothetical protein [bacterium]
MNASRKRLARVRRVREIQEELARADWLTAERSADAAEEASAAGFAEVAQAREQLGQRMESGLSAPTETLHAFTAIDRIEDTARLWRERARTLRFQADQKRAPWEERRRDVRALELLEDRAREAEIQEEFEAETLELDEVALRRATSKQAGPKRT